MRNTRLGGQAKYGGNRVEIDSVSLREIIKGNRIEKDVEFPTLSKDLSTAVD